MQDRHGSDPLDVEVGRVVQRLRMLGQPSAEQRGAVGTFVSHVLPASSARLLREHLERSSGPELASIVAAVVFDAEAPSGPGRDGITRGDAHDDLADADVFDAVLSGCRSPQLDDLVAEVTYLRRSL